MLQKYTARSAQALRWHDGSTHDVGPNSILETDSTNIIALGGVSYIATGSQINVLLNSTGTHIGIGTPMEDLPVKAI